MNQISAVFLDRAAVRRSRCYRLKVVLFDTVFRFGAEKSALEVRFWKRTVKVTEPRDTNDIRQNRAFQGGGDKLFFCRLSEITMSLFTRGAPRIFSRGGAEIFSMYNGQ